MNDTKRRRYGWVKSEQRLVGLPITLIVILLFMGLVIHTLAPSVNKFSKSWNISELHTPNFNSNESYGVKQACGRTEKNNETMASQNDVICLIHQYANQYGIETDIALRVAEAESNFKADAVNYNTNGSDDMGVYQINSVHGLSDECRLDARCNIEWAMQIMQKVGTKPWYSSKHKWYE